MMKKLNKQIIGSLFILAIMYLCAGFIAGDLNPDSWSMKGRRALVLLWVIASGFYFMKVEDRMGI